MPALSRQCSRRKAQDQLEERETAVCSEAASRSTEGVLGGVKQRNLSARREEAGGKGGRESGTTGKTEMRRARGRQRLQLKGEADTSAPGGGLRAEPRALGAPWTEAKISQHKPNPPLRISNHLLLMLQPCHFMQAHFSTRGVLRQMTCPHTHTDREAGDVLCFHIGIRSLRSLGIPQPLMLGTRSSGHTFLGGKIGEGECQGWTEPHTRETAESHPRSSHHSRAAKFLPAQGLFSRWAWKETCQLPRNAVLHS